MKLLALICLIILAGLGIGLTGGIPVSTSNKKQNTPEIKIELVESDEEKSDLKQTQVIK